MKQTPVRAPVSGFLIRSSNRLLVCFRSVRLTITSITHTTVDPPRLPIALRGNCRAETSSTGSKFGPDAPRPEKEKRGIEPPAHFNSPDPVSQVKFVGERATASDGTVGGFSLDHSLFGC